MMSSLRVLLISLLLGFFGASLLAQGNFSTSIHKTRKGKNYWYGADTSITHAPAPGFETLTNVPIDHPNVACASCHPGDNLDANGDPYPIPYPGMGCVDCHATNTSGWPVEEAQCYDCHSRQKTEAYGLGYSDVHRNASNPMVCWDCHQKEELHGDDGVAYNSMMEPGAIQSDCEDCHTSLPAGHSSNDPHNGKLHCDACHAQTAGACYNSHFESQVQAHLKRAKQQIHDFVMLANREKDGKVGTMSFQSLTYEGHSWVAFGPYHSHTITDQGRTCSDCHHDMGGQNTAIAQYNATGEIYFAEWNSADSTLSWIHGVIPMPADYNTSFKMDFLTYNGNPNDPVGPSKNWSYIGENTWDGHQMFFATPLNKIQMEKLGFDTTLTSIEPKGAKGIADGFRLQQNYPNPFNPATTIEFHLPKGTMVTVAVYNILGEKVATLAENRRMAAGSYTLPFDGKDLTSGVYVYRISTPEFSAAKKMVLMR